MHRGAAISLFVVSCVWAGATLVAERPAQQASAPQPAPEQPSPEDQAGAELLARMCNKCHDSARILERRRTRSDWQDIILKMMEKGAEGEAQEFETVFGYLCRHHGQVRVNDAPADEIMTTLALTRAEADAIVAYRAAHGPFADGAALAKVADVDPKKLEKAKDALVF